MKKLFSIPTLLAAAALTFSACSSSDDVSNTPENNQERSYLAITVRSVGAAPTSRAVNESNFEDGTDDENSISKIRFYFFDVNGNAFTLANASETGTNYIDKTSNDFVTETTGRTPNAIEKQVVVDIVSGTNNALPVSVIAVVNPDDVHPSLATGSKTVNDLRSSGLLTDKYATTADGKTNDFVMTNSVYDNNGSASCTSLIAGVNICTTQAEARQHPVDIYVERVAAKVRVKHADDSNWTTVDGKPAYKVGTTEGMNGVTTAEDIYAVIDGWGIADEAPRATVEKNIGTNEDWNRWTNYGTPATCLGFDTWTTADYHRCFWEITPAILTTGDPETTTHPVNHAFNDYKLGLGTTNANTSVAYTMPNTPTTARSVADETRNTVQTARTKVLVAAHLMKKVGDNWVNADLCEYKGQSYTSEDAVKAAVLGDHTGIWYSTDGGNTRQQLSTDDISYITFDANNSTVKDYQVVAKLTDAMSDATKYTYYTAGGNGGTTQTVAQVNEKLASLPVNVHHQGMTYYYVPIRHLATDPQYLGYFGVVRNHLYDVTIDTMGGFGTPVYDPDKTITPIIPTDEASYLSARINVLAWRIVSQNVDLNATE